GQRGRVEFEALGEPSLELAKIEELDAFLVLAGFREIDQRLDQLQVTCLRSIDSNRWAVIVEAGRDILGQRQELVGIALAVRRGRQQEGGAEQHARPYCSDHGGSFHGCSKAVR